MTADAQSVRDARYMRLALQLGSRGLGRTWPNPSVGAVIVRHADGHDVIAGRGLTQPGGRPHAEAIALARARPTAQGATLYVTLEPCSHHGGAPPCVDAIIAAGVSRVVSAVGDPNPLVAGQGHARLRQAGIHVDQGVLGEEAARAHAGHFRRIRDGRPHIALKLAVSADGKVGLAGRKPVAITGPQARLRAHLLRAAHDAIVIGIGTAGADDPLLTCRLPGMEDRSPIRVVLDSNLRLPLSSRLVATAKAVPLWVMAHDEAPLATQNALESAGARVYRVGGPDGRIDLARMAETLASLGLTRVLVEAGPILAAALVAGDLVDEAVLFRSPAVLGATALDALEAMNLDAIFPSSRFVLERSETIGADLMQSFWRA